MTIDVIQKCITITKEQDQKIRAMQVREMAKTGKSVSYSKILRLAVTEGLKQLQ